MKFYTLALAAPLASAYKMGLGNFVQDEVRNMLEIEIPNQLADELNNVLSLDFETEKLNFNFPEFNGSLGVSDGVINWNEDKNSWSYEGEHSDDFFSGSWSSRSKGEVMENEADFWGFSPDWASWDKVENGSWNFDAAGPVLDVEINDVSTAFTTSEKKFVVNSEMKLQLAAKMTQNSASLKSNMMWNLEGLDAIREYNPELAQHTGMSDIDYEGEASLSTNLNKCGEYFDNFKVNSACTAFIKYSDNLDHSFESELKAKHKFAFASWSINDGPTSMVYARSENQKNVMVGFDKDLFFSMRYVENFEGRAFDSIKQEGGMLIFRRPGFNGFMKHVYPVINRHMNRFSRQLGPVVENPAQIGHLVFWMDKVAATAKETSFDFSDVIIASRIDTDWCDYINQEALVAGALAMNECIVDGLIDFGTDNQGMKMMRQYVNSLTKSNASTVKLFGFKK